MAHVLVKDMSRIGRDYLQTGFYTEVMFRQYHVHFVAIANSVDSDDQNSNEFAPFLNVMNEWYLRDLSRKQQAAFRTKGESGKPLTNIAIYGYKKDPNDKNHWLIDEEAAEVVRHIYRLTIEGKTPFEITTILYNERIETPAAYHARQGTGLWKYKTDIPHPYSWNEATVKAILSKQEYAGDTVNFRTRKESYKDKQSVANPKENWMVFKDTHEAIVDRETWELVQKLIKTPRRVDTIGEANPLTGLVFCADCGAKMYNHRTRGNIEKKKYPADTYDCSTYNLSFRKKEPTCSKHRITTKALRILILETIKAACASAIKDKDKFLDDIRSASQLRQKEAVKDAKRKLNKSRRRINELDGIIKKLYESYAVGKITEERFDSLLAEYEAEQKELSAFVTETEQQLSTFEEDTVRAEQFLALAKKYTDFSELTTPMINEFIDKIVVHAPYYIDGERMQDVDIYLNFIGQFEIPEPELSEEEVKRQEQLRKKRVYERELYQKIKSGEHIVGKNFEVKCWECGKTFISKSTHAKFCCVKCRNRNYNRKRRQKKKEQKQNNN